MQVLFSLFLNICVLVYSDGSDEMIALQVLCRRSSPCFGISSHARGHIS